MGSSNKRIQARSWPGWPIVGRLKRMFADDAAAAPGWDTTTVAADVDSLQGQPCVLVVDDNPVNLLMASEMLSVWGIKPVLAADGAQAVALADELRLDLILMDIQMPVLDGLEATGQIRRRERELRRPRVPVVAYTSSLSIQLPLHAFGIDDVLDKPCEAQALRDCLMRWCPAKSGASSNSQRGASAGH